MAEVTGHRPIVEHLDAMSFLSWGSIATRRPKRGSNAERRPYSIPPLIRSQGVATAWLKLTERKFGVDGAQSLVDRLSSSIRPDVVQD